MSQRVAILHLPFCIDSQRNLVSYSLSIAANMEMTTQGKIATATSVVCSEPATSRILLGEPTPEDYDSQLASVGWLVDKNHI